jgi:hypothetical protein
MSMDTVRKCFTAEHHALLFAWLVREIIGRAGERNASPVIRGAVRRYGMQRGRRMALRARRNGHDLSMLNYLVYGEWKAGKGEMVTNIAEKKPAVRAVVPRCPWHTAWKEQDLMPFGRYYCLDVDTALVRGFNPELKLELGAIKPDGAAECDFLFHGAALGPAGMARFLYRKLVMPGKSARMPWDYHAGHLCRTMGDELVAEFGVMGREAVDAALAEFARRYGEEAAAAVRGYGDTDFDRLPAGS